LLCNLEQNKTLKRKKGCVRIAKKATPKVIKAIERKFNHHTGFSQRKTASAFNLTISHVNYILKKYSDIRKYKKFKRPLMNDQQKAQLRKHKCRKLVRARYYQ
jgi:DNA invertase Pin-like site-specific DNA recombinase